MIQITQVQTVDETAFDHVKCPQCRTRLCGKPKNVRVKVLQLSRNMRNTANPLLFDCKRCGNHYLVSTEE